MKNTFAKWGLASGILLAALYAEATTVNMTYGDANTYAESGFTASLDSSTIITGNDLIGLYAFSINSINPVGGATITTPFYTTCLSPAGLLDRSAHDYTLQTFQQANPGINPNNQWAYSGSDYYGIQNANYLFTTLKDKIVNGNSGQAGNQYDQAAALAFAMYKALYDSTGYGKALNTRFSVSLTGNVLTDYNTDVTMLGNLIGVDPKTLPDGYVLRPVDYTTPGSQQDMILLASGVPQGGVVPEPTTMIAGLLLLLPFGASTIRILRRNRAA